MLRVNKKETRTISLSLTLETLNTSVFRFYSLIVTCIWQLATIIYKKQPPGGVLEKMCSFMPADIDILINFLVFQERFKMLEQ